MSDHHPKFPDFVQVSSLDVDAGAIWIGDPCYVIQDAGEARPKDLGEKWGDICSRFYTRSGYHKACSGLRQHQYAWERRRNEACMPQITELSTLDLSEDQAGEALAQVYRTWEAANPIEDYVPTGEFRDHGFAIFTFDAGHGGMGAMLSTYDGDGSYPLYIEYGLSYANRGRPRRVLVDFAPGMEEDFVPEVPEGKGHPSFPGFAQVSTVSVDAGCVWYGDPCYILKDPDEARPKDLGADWGEFCDLMFERSGLNAYEEARADHTDTRRYAFFDWAGDRLNRVEGDTPASRSAKYKTLMAEFDAVVPEPVFSGGDLNKGFANFNHDEGHAGMGTVTDTFYGDGGYPVYIFYAENGRPRYVLVDYDPGADEPDDEEEDEA